MPYAIVHDTSSCPASKPWAVKTQGGPDDGNVHGCHPTKAAARQQQKAMYANIPASDLTKEEVEKHDEAVQAVFRWHPEAYVRPLGQIRRGR